MKPNQNRVRANGKAAAVQSQSQNHAAAVEITDLEAMKRESRYRFNRPIAGPGLGISFHVEWSDEHMLDYVCGVLASNIPALEKVGDKPGDKAAFAEMLLIAHAVARRCEWMGTGVLPKEPTMLRTNRRPAMLLDLPGLSGRRAWNDDDMLFAVCATLYRFREEVMKVVSELPARRALGLAEALMIAEQAICRDGCSTDADEADGNSAVRQLAEDLRGQVFRMEMDRLN